MLACVRVCVCVCVSVRGHDPITSSYVITQYHVRMLSTNPLNSSGVGQFVLGESQSRIYPHMRAKFGRGPTVVSKKGGGYRHTDYETFTSMSGTILPTMCQPLVCSVQYCQQCFKFGDPVTQLIVTVYKMIKL